MMNVVLFVKGLLSGLFLSIPTGPMGILCIRRSISKGRWYGFISGLGIATADVIYSYLALSGLAFLDPLLNQYRVLVQIVVGCLVCYLGMYVYYSKPMQRVTSASATDFFNSYISALALTLSNPFIIFVFTLIFTTLRIEIENPRSMEAAIVVAGIFIGSSLWWLILSNIAHTLRSRITIDLLERLNRIAGFAIVIFGFAILFGFIRA